MIDQHQAQNVTLPSSKLFASNHSLSVNFRQLFEFCCGVFFPFFLSEYDNFFIRLPFFEDEAIHRYEPIYSTAVNPEQPKVIGVKFRLIGIERFISTEIRNFEL